MKTNRLFLYVLCCLVLLTAVPYLVADAVTKIQVNTDSAQTISNKTFDNTNIFNGGTFNAQALTSPTFTTPTWSSGAFTLTPVTANSLLYANASKQLTSTANPTNGQMLIGSTGAAPVLGTLAGTANQVTVTNGAGSITLSTPQSIHTAATPTFAGLTLSGLTASKLVATDGSKALTSLSSAIAVMDGGTGTASIPSNGQLLIGNGTNYTLSTLLSGPGMQISNASGSITLASIPRGYLSGLELSTDGASTTMTIAAGQAVDSTGARMIALAASLGKNTGAWALGTGFGCLDTGVAASNTWYSFHVIFRSDTGVSDVLCSLSASSPTLPTNYTHFRRIGSGRTNGATQWTLFYQSGDEFLWGTPVLDVNTTNPGTSAVLSTLTVPPNVTVWAQINRIIVTGAGGAVSDLVSSPAQTDAAPSLSAAPGATLYVPASSNGATRLSVRTNTSAQARSRLSFSDASTISRMVTVGWIDRRGRDA